MDTVLILKGVAMILTFVVIVALMMSKKLPTIIALPIMAIAFALIAGVPFMSNDPESITIFKTILQKGASRMSDAMAGLMFGAWFAHILNRLGITKGIVKKAAELGGDNPMITGIVFFIAASVIFMASNSLGMVILVGNIIIPIMITTGISSFNAGLITLLAGSVGGMMNISTWPMYVDTLGVTLQDVRSNIWIPFVPFAIIALIIVVVSIKKDSAERRAWTMPNANMGVSKKKEAPFYSFIAPVIPVLLVFILKLDIVPAIIIAVLVALVLVRPKRPIHLLSSSLVEGIQDVAGALALFIGIGMLIMTVSAPEVSSVLLPVIELVIPKTVFGHILFFTLLAPFAIYRGPMNLFGLGAGISALLISSGMNPLAVMIGMQSVGNVQGTCDPTNSFSVWIADFTKTEVTDYLRKTIVWVLIAVAVSMVIGMPIILG